MTDAAMTSFFSFCISAGLIATLASSAFAFAGRNTILRGVGHALLISGAALGALSSAVLLIFRAESLPILPTAASIGIKLGIYPLSAVFFLIVNAIVCIVASYAVRYTRENRDMYHLPSLGGLTSIFIFGMQLTILAASAPMFMLAWEMMSLSSFALVMADRKASSRHAAILYFAMAQLGAAAIMAGLFILSGGNPLTDFSMLAANAPNLAMRDIILAFILFFVGFGSKAGLVPMHTWLPEAHPQAPSHISALMSGVMLKVAVYGFILTCLILLPSLPAAGLAVMGIGIISAMFGALHAAVDTDLKRTLAWSSVENLGMIFLMIGTVMFARTNGMTALADIAFAAAIFHCAAHAIFKTGLFLSAGGIVHAAHTRNLERMGGLAKRMPTFSGAFLVLCLTAAALPPFAGFIGEWLYITGLIGSLSGATPLVQAVVVLALVATAFTSGIAVFAMVKLFAISQLGAPRSPAAENAKDPTWSIRLPVFLLSALAAAAAAFAPALLALFGFGKTAAGLWHAPLTLPGGTLSPLALTTLVAASVLLLALAKRALSATAEREYHTWDCGQPITPRMEYTATAFSAPIRFFFRRFVGIRKSVIVSGATSGPLASRREMVIVGRSFLLTHLHEPVVRALHLLGSRTRRIQSGSIQLSLLFILFALVATLIIAV